MIDMLHATRTAVEATPNAHAVALAPEWAERRGTMRDQPVTLHSWAWQTPTLAWVRALAMEVGERTQIFAALATPAPQFDLPLFGVEVFRINGSVSMLALDWIPMAEQPYAEALAAIHPRYTHFPPMADMSEWAEQWLSPYAIHARPQQAVGESEVFDAFSSYWDSYMALASSATPHGDPAQTLATQRRFFEQYHAENPGHPFLAKLFGEEWARGYAGDFLFRPGGMPLF
jgi:hypothetical protein